MPPPRHQSTPSHLAVGSESNPSAEVGTLGICVMVAAFPNQPAPAWGSLASPPSQGGAGTGVQVEMVGEDRSCATLG